METITIEGEAGRIQFMPAGISHAKVLKIEEALKKLVEASNDFITADVMRALLKEKDSLIGTPGGALKGYRAREGITQKELSKKTGIRQSHISEMEKNKRNIGVKTAKILAKVLRCNYHRFL